MYSIFMLSKINHMVLLGTLHPNAENRNQPDITY